MSRYSGTAATKGQPTFEGDDKFVALDMETRRDLLPPGHYADGKNARCATGALAKRGGIEMPFAANSESDFRNGILGADLFNNPNSDTKLALIATVTNVWKIAPGGIPIAVGLPEGVTLAGRVEFSQHFDKLLLHQSDGRPTYQWDGDPARAFEPLAQVHPTAENTLVPPADWSIDFSTRALYPFGRDRFIVSDSEDYGSYDAVTRNYRANAGTADTLTGLYQYAGANLIIGKRSSIDVFKNFRGDLSQFTAEVVNGRLGIFARKSWQMIGSDQGSDAFFLSKPDGVFRLSQVDQDRLTAPALPVAVTRDSATGQVTNPIAPLLRRVNWDYAHLAVSGMDGPYYVLAAPIDGSRVNNCLLYLNAISEKWEGYDLFPAGSGMQVDALLPFDYNGEQRLWAVNYAAGTLHVLNEGREDVLPNGRYEIELDWTSRAFATLGWNASPKRDFKRVVIAVRTSRPSITLEEVTEGANDNRVLTMLPITKDRTKFSAFGKQDFDPTNADDSALEPGREDYSVVLSDTPGSPEPSEIIAGSGFDPDQFQESVLGGPGGFSTKCRARALSYRVRCTQGTTEILGVLVESDAVQREVRVAA